MDRLFGRKFRYTFWKSLLLFFYDNKAYIPKEGSYDSEWEEVKDGISKCECSGDTGEDSNCCKLLKALVRVVGFLNTVQLEMHPNSKKNGTCSTSSGVSTASTCTPAEKNGTCTYSVHQYGGKQVKISVKCTAVKGKEPSSNGKSCYKKLTHEPMGMCNARTSSSSGDGKGFRLGNVVYESKSQGSIEYYSNGTDSNKSECNWLKPLLKVEAYFYDEDKGYNDPLLVVLEFKKNGQGTANVCEYYKLTTSGTGGMKWEKDTDPETCKKLCEGKCDDLVKYLDGIRYYLKKVLKVEIHQNSGKSYKAMGRDGKTKPGGAVSNGFEQLNGGKGQVNVEAYSSDRVCPKLSGHNYKCYCHQLTALGPDVLHKIGGVAFTIPSDNGKDKPIELKLYDDGATKPPKCENGKPGKNGQIDKLFYNKCMEDVYVFFYDGTTAGVKPNSVDSVPLMLWYNYCYYAPCDRESYFDKWVPVSELSDKGKQVPPSKSDVKKLVKQLNDVNKSLNRIDLNHEKVSELTKGTGTAKSGYGLPESVKVSVRPSPTFNTKRVTLTKQEGPKQPQPAYVKIVHRTFNGFEIGEIKYNGQEIVENGITPNGAEIRVKQNGSNGGHTSLVTQKGCNTVVAYYSSSDGDFQLPQLIVILKTDKEVSSEPVTGSDKETAYGYYILSAKSSASGAGSAANGGGSAGTGVNYEYVWHPVTKQTTAVTLDSATDFSLLNSIVILLEQRPNNGEKTSTTYGDSEISSAITKANLTSPGRSNGEINRITGKEISVKNETVSKDATESCLNDTGFKLITHDISQLVNPNGKLNTVLSSVKLIAGLRFLIPFKTKNYDSYKELKLTDNNGSGQHYLYYRADKHKVCGYFYDQDPRPLMLCYDGKAYRPKDMLYYFTEWVREKSISYCGCIDPSIISVRPSLQPLYLIFAITMESALKTLRLSEQSGAISKAITNAEELVKALVRVSNLLNPVKLDRIMLIVKNRTTESKSTNENIIKYNIHTYKGEKIRIKVELTPPEDNFCYNKYTYTHCGTGSNGSGFRLGTIYYGCNCIKLKDKDDDNGCITSQLVNESTPTNYKSADKVVVFYYKHDTSHKYPMVVAMGTTNGVTTMCKLFYTLVDKGNKIYEKRVETAEFNLDNNDAVTTKLDEALFSNNNKLQIILDRRPVVKLYTPDVKTPECNESPTDKKLEEKLECISKREYAKMYYIVEKKPTTYYLPTKTLYQAQLYEPNNSQAPNGPKETSIQVTLLDCPKLSRHGYRCYEHQITGVTKVEEIGGLKFYLWDNTKGQGVGGGPGGKELCLYKVGSGADSAAEGAILRKVALISVH